MLPLLAIELGGIIGGKVIASGINKILKDQEVKMNKKTVIIGRYTNCMKQNKIFRRLLWI